MAEHGLSAEMVSKAALRQGHEIARPTISQIVNGKTPSPGIVTLAALAAGINRPLEEVLEKALGKPVVELRLPRDFAVLADLYSQLPLPEQRGIKRYKLQTLEREMRRILTQLSESD